MNKQVQRDYKGIIFLVPWLIKLLLSDLE